MNAAIVVLVLMLWSIGLISYLSSLKKVFSLANERNIAIFGKYYGSFSAMGSDTHFLNSLWSGKEIGEHADLALIAKLSAARKILVFQLVFSLFIFFLLMLSAVIR